ncbi:hypothetical protein SAMN05421827_10264 [Pedobacter terrae]|uniref:Uncharacterized protein n=1 Tax=Pedobacter terrae TaxID=405671 RepID=A0A1G7PW33_9SPHI|nr:hypothetical protein [Pedobacter terrae]SDF90474.1 hypothetical protein SAMN05421827_10264 [Pedobacter terrae]
MFEKKNSALIFEEFQGRKNKIKDLIKVPVSDPMYLKFLSEYIGLEITPDIGSRGSSGKMYRLKQFQFIRNGKWSKA